MIPVYQAEIDAGLEIKIKASASISCVSPIQPRTIAPKNSHISKAKIQEFFEARAALDDPDMYFSHAILVSSVWNKNDEVFLKEEIIAAKHTPIYKKVNLNHDETKIVGVMVAAYVVDDEGNLLDDATLASDECPDLIHILSSQAVYRKWESEDLQKSVDSVIEKIESSEQFVSMECLFSDYDYCVMDNQGKCTIVKRNQKTAFLSAALRIYGGTGEYQGYKIARVPRQLVFCGVGFVDKPANPDSVTFTAESISEFITASENLPFLNESGVSLNREDTSVSNKQESEIIMANDTNEVVERLTTEKVGLEATIATLTSEKTSLTAKIAELEAAAAKSVTDNAAVATELATLKQVNADLQTAKTDIETKYNAIQAQALEQARVSTLVEGGLSKEDAVAKVKEYGFASDEQFVSISKLILASVVKPVQVVTPEQVETENASAKTLETAEANKEAALTVASESTKTSLETVRADLKTFASQLFNNNKKTQKK